MPRPLTTNERAYLGDLAVRNLCDEPEDPTTGKETPMPPDERMRRKRIRDKAKKAIRDLKLADRAGVINLSDELKGARAGEDMLLALYMEDGEITAEGEDRTDLFYKLLGKPPEDVPPDL